MSNPPRKYATVSTMASRPASRGRGKFSRLCIGVGGAIFVTVLVIVILLATNVIGPGASAESGSGSGSGSGNLPLASPEVNCAKTHKPHIVIFYADDQGYGDRQKYSPEYVRMPNYEKVAESGIDFTDGHTGSGVCSPSRFALLTGEYFFRYSSDRNAIGSNGHTYMMDAADTLPRMLKRAGYKTYMSGKWHLGFDVNDDDLTQPLRGGPVDAGFDKFFGIPASMDYGRLSYIYNDTYRQPPTYWSDRWNELIWSCPTNTSSCHTWGIRTCDKAVSGECVKGGYHYPNAGGYGKANRKKNGGSWDLSIGQDFEPNLCLSNITHQAIQYIDDHMNQYGNDKPFFLYMPVNSPHKPHVPHPDFDGKSGLGSYVDFLEETDFRLGQIMDTLDRWDIADNTLLMVSSDNGPESKEMFYDSMKMMSAYIYNEDKRSLFEGGHRVPFMMRWPNVIPRGRTVSHAVSQVDIMSTFTQMTGSYLAPKGGADSFSFWQAVCDPDGATDAQVRDLQPLISEVPEKVSGKGPGVGIRCGSDKILADSKGWHMFDIDADPRELTNVADQRKTRFNELKSLLTEVVNNGFSSKTNVCI